MKTITTRDRMELEKRRKKAGKLFQKGVRQSKVAEILKVTTAASCKWHAAWKSDRKEGLLSKGPTGIDPFLDSQKRKILKEAILKGPVKAGYATDFWTLERIRVLAKKKLKINLGTTSVWRTVIGLGFSAQKPERRARERNEKAITDWKLKSFPRLKKMGQETRISVGISG
jgi:transposase